MLLAARIVVIGERLVVLARDVTDDANKAHLLAHKALRTLLRNDPSLSRTDPSALRQALHLSLARLGARSSTIARADQTDAGS
ncbi:MAG: hypothetical protein KF779_08705 [Hyphomonadaceae bacterium]|nr:hypothetical protein [Hyphomonadaceae bacterium]